MRSGCVLALFVALLSGDMLNRFTIPMCYSQEPIRAATTIQLPTFGVAVDAEGELTVRAFADPTGRIRAERIAAARDRLAADVAAPSPLRKVSLVALERSLAARLDEGQPAEESQLYLAGLQRIRYVFLDPEAKDIVIAGPAEGWFTDASGRVVGTTTGRPTLRLDDLAVALRAFSPRRARRPFLGCTIDPSPDSLARFRQFQRTIPNVVRPHQRLEVSQAAVQGVRSALGTADIRVFGISPATHFARVLVEADYRMKCLAIGLEPPPVPRLKTYLASLRSPPANGLQRWWLTPNYECLRLSDDGLALEMVGSGVELRTEDMVIAADGKLVAVATDPHPAAAAFAQSFTEHFPAISAASPVYAELRNVIDLAIVAAWLRRENALARTGWDGELILDEARLAVETFPTARKAACVANAVWNGNRMLLPAGGGVSIVPDEAFNLDRILAPQPAAATPRAAVSVARPDGGSWWWD